MAGPQELPSELTLVRTTESFTEQTVPQGLRRAHRIADDVWGRLVVTAGSVVFVFEDEPSAPRRLSDGRSQIIPPGRLHRVETPDPTEFHIEFYR